MKVLHIYNAYITAPVKDKIWKFLGREFCEDYSRKAILARAIYGLKSAGTAFRNHLTDCMYYLEFLPCYVDPYIWMKHMVRPVYGFKYYTYVLIYVYDVIIIHLDAESVLRKLKKFFKLKHSLIGDPDIYLGAKLKKMRLKNGVCAWANRPARYVKE